MRIGAPLTQIRGLPGEDGLPGPIRHVWEAPMFTERTSVGLDVHALSVCAAGLDTATGQLFEETLTPSS